MLRRRSAGNRSSDRAPRHRGQSTAEYVLVIVVVTAAVIGMQLYMKRNLQAKIRDVADSSTGILTKAGISNIPRQYEPYYSSQTVVPREASRDFDATEGFAVGGSFKRTVTKEQTSQTGTTKSGVDLTADDLWQ